MTVLDMLFNCGEKVYPYLIRVNYFMRRLVVPAWWIQAYSRKNIRDFCGRPMITHILNTARFSDLFTTIYVSSECEEIRSVASQFGFLRISPCRNRWRPHSILPVLRHAVEEYAKRGVEFDEVWLLMACAPLVNAEDLQSAAVLFIGGHKSLLAVTEYPVPIEWAFRRGPSSILQPVRPGQFSVRSQDLEKHYFDAGCFAVFPASRVLESQGAGSDADFIGYVLPKNSAIDIDDEQDWQIAEAIFRHKSALSNS